MQIISLKEVTEPHPVDKDANTLYALYAKTKNMKRVNKKFQEIIDEKKLDRASAVILRAKFQVLAGI